MLIHESIVNAILDRCMVDQEWQDALYYQQRCINSGVVPRRYLDIVCQPHYERQYDLADAWCFSWINYKLMEKHFGLSVVYLGEMPGPDSDVIGNNAKLSRLPYPFVAEFVPQTGGAGPYDDGWIMWDKPIHAALRYRNDPSRSGYCLVKPNSINTVYLPYFEVGSFQSTKVYYWLGGPGGVTGGLARWPYGSDWIYIIHTPETLVLPDDPLFEGMKEIAANTLEQGLPDSAIDPWKVIEGERPAPGPTRGGE